MAPRIDTRLEIQNCIPQLRAKKNLTQQELADAVGVTRATVVALERGNYNPSLELAYRLARYFNTRIDSVFNVEEE